jgi:hypothetical protein
MLTHPLMHQWKILAGRVYEMPMTLQTLPGLHAPPPRCGVRRRAHATLREWLLSVLLATMPAD